MTDYQHFRKAYHHILSAKSRFKPEPNKILIKDDLDKAGQSLDILLERVDNDERYEVLKNYQALFASFAYSLIYFHSNKEDDQKIMEMCLNHAGTIHQKLKSQNAATQELVIEDCITKVKQIPVENYSASETERLLQTGEIFDNFQRRTTLYFLEMAAKNRFDENIFLKALEYGFRPGNLEFRLSKTKPKIAKKIRDLFDYYQEN